MSFDGRKRRGTCFFYFAVLSSHSSTFACDIFGPSDRINFDVRCCILYLHYKTIAMIIVYIYQICLGPEVENSLSHAQPNEEKATSFCCCSISPFIYTAESGERAPNSDDSSTLTQRICNSPPSQKTHLQIRK